MRVVCAAPTEVFFYPARFYYFLFYCGIYRWVISVLQIIILFLTDRSVLQFGFLEESRLHSLIVGEFKNLI